MNKRIAKKIEQAYHDSADWYDAYSVPQRRKAYRMDLRRLKRKAAAVRAKRGWSQRGSGWSPDASWLPNPYAA